MQQLTPTQDLVVCRSLTTCVHNFTGDAAHGFPLTNNNYPHSIALIKDRFGQPYKSVNAHMDALLNLGKPSNSLNKFTGLL